MPTLRPSLTALAVILLVPSVAGSLTLPGPEAQGLPAPDVPKIDSALLDAPPTPQAAILVLDPTREDSVLADLAKAGIPRHPYPQLHMVAILVDPATLPAVAALPGVLSVHHNERMAPLLDRSTDYVGADVVWDTYGVTGEGVTIMIMDSGIDGTHPDVRYGKTLIENVVPTRDAGGLVDGSESGIVASDPDGHGTHVAAVAAGSGAGSQGRFRGVAPGARLVGYQAGLADPKTGEISFESLTVLEGFDWVLEHQQEYDIRIVSNSWGANGEFDPRSPVNIATLNLYKAGILVLFAAGNEGEQGAHTLNKYSLAPWVLSVTAGDYLNNVPRFASRGVGVDDGGRPYDHPDLVAPGVGITSARRLSGADPARLPEDALYATKSGTSMATPHVAGIAALLLEANPELGPDDLMDVLTATATPLRSGTATAGAGFLNGLHAFQLAGRAEGHRDEFLSGRVKYAGPQSGDADYSRDAVSVGYLRGEANRLRSPDKSAHEFAAELLTTVHGHLFLWGGLVLSGLAFGPGRRAQPGVVARPRADPPSPIGSGSSFFVMGSLPRPTNAGSAIAGPRGLGRPKGFTAAAAEHPRNDGPEWDSIGPVSVPGAGREPTVE